jgi:hypothetical protein
MFDKNSLAKLASIMPQMVTVLTKFHDDLLTSTGIEFHVTDGYRSFDDEDKLFLQGRYGNPGKVVTEVRGGYSMHNFGLAVDCYPGKVNGAPWQPDWDGTDEHFRTMVQYGEKWGFNCGADWHGFVDRPHFQFPGIPTEPTEQMRADYRAGGLQRIYSQVLGHYYGPLPAAFIVHF